MLAIRYAAPKDGFPRKFSAQDVALLTELDALHGALSGPATKCLLQRAVVCFGDTRYEPPGDDFSGLPVQPASGNSDAAHRLNEARKTLFLSINRRSKHAA